MVEDSASPDSVGPRDPTIRADSKTVLEPGVVLANTETVTAVGLPGEPAEQGDGEVPTLPGYAISNCLGRGGMGTVYLARQDPPGRDVALKVVQRTAGDEDTVLRFQREVGAVAKMNHPHIVTVFEVGASDRFLHFSMTLIDGDTLKDAVDERRIAMRAALTLVQKIAEALHYAHQRGIVHRDVKPENILLDRDGTPFLTDFGLARDLSASGVRVTQTGAIAGTPVYMSPEQAAGDPGIDHRTDVYSLGATLYELLALRPPFDGKTVVAVLAKVLHEEPPRLRSLDPRLPRDVETIVEKAMRKDRNDRYTSAAEFAADLRRTLGGRPIEARPVPAVVRLGMSVRRNPLVSALTAAVVLAVLSLVGVVVVERDQRLAAQERSLHAALSTYREAESSYWLAQERREQGQFEAAEETSQRAEQLYVDTLELVNESLALGPFGPRAPALRAAVRRRLVERAEGEGDARLARLLLPDLQLAVRGMEPGEERARLAAFAAGAGRIAIAVTPWVEGISVLAEVHPQAGPPPSLEASAPAFRLDSASMGVYRFTIAAPGYAPVTLPLYVARQEEASARVRLLKAHQIPEGMLYVPEGSFFQGGSDPGARPFARRALPGFLIDRDEVTFGAYRAFLNSLPPAERQARAPREDGPDALPVVGITWEDAQAFAASLGKRLPSEDEWVRAARGADPRAYSFGERGDLSKANVAKPRLGSRAPGATGDTSPFGCRDMAGNVSEFVADLYWPERADGPRVRRGGAWALDQHYARITYRDPIAPGERRRYLGFRCAKDLP